MLLFPGLVNSHFHSTGTFNRAFVANLPLELFMLYELPPFDFGPFPPELYRSQVLWARLADAEGGRDVRLRRCDVLPRAQRRDRDRADGRLSRLGHPRDGCRLPAEQGRVRVDPRPRASCCRPMSSAGWTRAFRRRRRAGRLLRAVRRALARSGRRPAALRALLLGPAARDRRVHAAAARGSPSNTTCRSSSTSTRPSCSGSPADAFYGTSMIRHLRELGVPRRAVGASCTPSGSTSPTSRDIAERRGDRRALPERQPPLRQRSHALPPASRRGRSDRAVHRRGDGRGPLQPLAGRPARRNAPHDRRPRPPDVAPRGGDPGRDDRDRRPLPGRGRPRRRSASARRPT